jgi:hypothetical protein
LLGILGLINVGHIAGWIFSGIFFHH